jgi:uncharacterized protein
VWSVLANELALDRPPAVLRDPAWWLLAAAGMLSALALWTVAGLDPGGAVPPGTARWLGVIGWQPLIEELLFRGLLQGALLRTRVGARGRGHLTVANLASSLAFVAVHFVHHPPLWAVATLVPSLALGWIRERHRSTWSAVVTHVLFNAEFYGVAAALSA